MVDENQGPHAPSISEETLAVIKIPDQIGSGPTNCLDWEGSNFTFFFSLKPISLRYVINFFSVRIWGDWEEIKKRKLLVLATLC